MGVGQRGSAKVFAVPSSNVSTMRFPRKINGTCLLSSTTGDLCPFNLNAVSTVATQVQCDRIVRAFIAVAGAPSANAIAVCTTHPVPVAACRWGETGDNVGNAAATRLQFSVNVVSPHSSMLEGLATRLHCGRTASETPNFLTQNPVGLGARQGMCFQLVS